MWSSRCCRLRKRAPRRARTPPEDYGKMTEEDYGKMTEDYGKMTEYYGKPMGRLQEDDGR